MPVHRILENVAFEPERLALVTDAIADTIRDLHLSPSDAAAERIARHIFDLARQGERDPGRLRERTIRELGLCR
ncbi:MAG: hypothetical protein IT536_10070 [Hyphomicrobiales bacterium]|nr:hypothetical protein [Hyphomicrobiales bacterium]